MRVVIIGAGIGGLCLAHGLRRAGVEVAVYERNQAAGSRWEGYRIHLNPAGSRSLRACLPDRLWDAFVATAGPAGDFGFLTKQLRELVVVEESVLYPHSARNPAENHYAVDRRVLRRLLLSGLEDATHYGADVVGYESTSARQMRALFADGRAAVGDVLVGADGSSSRIRRQLLPHAAPVPVGAIGISHKTFLTESTRQWIPARLQTGMNRIMVDEPLFLFTSAYNPPPRTHDVLRTVTGQPVDGADEPYILSALVADRSVFPDQLALADDVAAAVDGVVADWHPALRRLLADSDPSSRRAIEFTAAPAVDPWTSAPVTLLGDAAHVMPPVGGLGGNAALRDARLLSDTLAAVNRGDGDLLDAIARYETGMRDHGYAAVHSGQSAVASLSTGRIGAAATRTWFRLCRRIPALRRRTFQRAWADAKPMAWETT
jgi:2-polyprenyl-6-methoxyphenol hydroxylase-like FAD-dependent oxidoreductase